MLRPNVSDRSGPQIRMSAGGLLAPAFGLVPERHGPEGVLTVLCSCARLTCGNLPRIRLEEIMETLTEATVTCEIEASLDSGNTTGVVHRRRKGYIRCGFA
jgi:hypothetical protein